MDGGVLPSSGSAYRLNFNVNTKVTNTLTCFYLHTKSASHVPSVQYTKRLTRTLNACMRDDDGDE